MKFFIPMFVRLFVALFAITRIVFADFAQKDRHKHSLSAQIGANGVSGVLSTFGLQFFPFDASYAYKFFDNNRYSLSTATFYDNIGVEMEGMNFNYRIGQRVDFGIETKDSLFYGTIGLANLFIDNSTSQISPVYGFGFARDITHHFAIVTEINFQDVWKAMGHYNIANFSVGLIYCFDI